MKIIDFRELKSTKFSLHDISVIYQSPTWNSLGNDKHKRTLNGFLLIDNGECKYEWDGGEANLKKGSLIAVDGKLNQRSYEDTHGNKRKVFEVI